MQGLADGYFILPYTIGNYLATAGKSGIETSHTEFKGAETDVNSRIEKFMGINGKRSVDSFHREAGKVMLEHCGMARNEEGLKKALEKLPAIRAEFWENVRVPGETKNINQSLEMAGRVADFLEIAELMCLDALHREESCGGHFRDESKTPEGEALRDDKKFAYSAAWHHNGEDKAPDLNKESLSFENVKLSQRSYK